MPTRLALFCETRSDSARADSAISGVSSGCFSDGENFLFDAPGPNGGAAPAEPLPPSSAASSSVKSSASAQTGPATMAMTLITERGRSYVIGSVTAIRLQPNIPGPNFSHAPSSESVGAAAEGAAATRQRQSLGPNGVWAKPVGS